MYKHSKSLNFKALWAYMSWTTMVPLSAEPISMTMMPEDFLNLIVIRCTPTNGSLTTGIYSQAPEYKT